MAIKYLAGNRLQGSNAERIATGPPTTGSDTYLRFTTGSGTFVPTFNNNIMSTPTAAAFNGVNSTKIQLVAVSDFTSAQACVISHNIFPGDTAGHIWLHRIRAQMV